MVRTKCEASVKDRVKSFHTKCCHDRPLIEVFGKDLNAALDIIDFETNQRYQICFTLYHRKIKPALKKIQEENQKNEKENPNAMECTDAQQSTKQSRTGFRTKFPTQVLEKCDLFRNPYMSLSIICRENSELTVRED